jgi:hypothetical protein
MRSILHLPSSILALLFLLAAAPTPKPRPNAHAHNDYEHPRPLQDALDAGFCNVEADVHLVAGQFLVAHDPRALDPLRTLQSLYLDPLKKRIAEQGGQGGHVFPNSDAVLTLMIDVKSDARASHAALRDLLKTYAPILTVYRKDKVTPGPVRILISGNRDRAAMTAEATTDEPRYAALDGQLQDLSANPSPPASLVPWISGEWKRSFKWTGTGPMPEGEAAKLKSLANQAHAQHRQLRFWGAPDTEPVWRALRDANVDLINTDNLQGLAAFLK